MTEKVSKILSSTAWAIRPSRGSCASVSLRRCAPGGLLCHQTSRWCCSASRCTTRCCPGHGLSRCLASASLLCAVRLSPALYLALCAVETAISWLQLQRTLPLHQLLGLRSRPARRPFRTSSQMSSRPPACQRRTARPPTPPVPPRCTAFASPLHLLCRSLRSTPARSLPAATPPWSPPAPRHSLLTRPPLPPWQPPRCPRSQACLPPPCVPVP